MEPDLSLVGDGLKLDQVEPIAQKRLLAFVNFWISRNVQVLNSLGKSAEEMLFNVDQRIDQMTMKLSLLEAKLNSVPGLENIVVSQQANNQELAKTEPTPTIAPIAKEEEKKIEADQVPNEPTPPTPNESQATGPKNLAKNDPRYAKYFKMLAMGVPMVAVAQKVQMDGYSPSVLENPDAEIDPPMEEGNSDEEFGSESSDDFSD